MLALMKYVLTHNDPKSKTNTHADQARQTNFTMTRNGRVRVMHTDYVLLKLSFSRYND